MIKIALVVRDVKCLNSYVITNHVVFCAEKQQTLDELERMVGVEHGPSLKEGGTVKFVRFREFMVSRAAREASSPGGKTK